MNNKSRHEFAVYWPLLSGIVNKQTKQSKILLDDKDLYHRIITVLRLKQHDRLILFDDTHQVNGELGEVAKKNCDFHIESVKAITPLHPAITFGLPLLKKEAFESALYSLVELGATTIQLLITQKVHRSDWSAKEAERSQRVMISAAEQSKNFAIPNCNNPIKLQDFLQNQLRSFDIKIFFDAEGQPFSTIFKELTISERSSIFIMIGPEGDLTPEEKELLKMSGFLFAALTPTILRSCQAAGLGLGVLRTLL